MALLVIRSKVLDDKCVCYSTFKAPDSAKISDSWHSISHGFVSASLGGSFPLCTLFLFKNWQVLHLEQTPCTVFLKFFQWKCWEILSYVRVSPGWHNALCYHSTTWFSNCLQITVFQFLQIREYFLLDTWKCCTE